MKNLAVSNLFGIAALNCFLAISGQDLAYELRRTFQHYGTKPTILAEIAFVLPPFFYVVALGGLAFAAFGLLRRLRHEGLLLAAVCFLALDIVGLLILLWGFCGNFFMLGSSSQR